MDLEIRPCQTTDVPTLDRVHPSPSVESFHLARHQAQQTGGCTYLLARFEDDIVGHALIKWDGCDEPEVRRQHPNVPEINALDVFPASLRSRGIGTRLITSCEQLAAGNGRSAIGLGVADVNPRAAALYARLGYRGNTRYIDRYSCLDSRGVRHLYADPCVFLTKPLESLSNEHHRTNDARSISRADNLPFRSNHQR